MTTDTQLTQAEKESLERYARCYLEIQVRVAMASRAAQGLGPRATDANVQVVANAMVCVADAGLKAYEDTDRQDMEDLVVIACDSLQLPAWRTKWKKEEALWLRRP